MVALMAPTAKDIVCDPACGTCEHLPPKAILKKLAALETEIASGMRALEALLKKAE